MTLLVVMIAAGTVCEIGGIWIGYRAMHEDWDRSMELALQTRTEREVIDDLLAGGMRQRRLGLRLFAIGALLTGGASIASFFVT